MHAADGEAETDEAETDEALPAGVAVLQRLFPGRVVRIDAADDPAPHARPPAERDDDGESGDRESDATER